LDKHPNESWATLFSLYQSARKKNGDAVADLALQNFIEMRDLIADPDFLMRKKIEKELGKLFPNRFNSVYEMVSFSHTSYHFALSAQKAQDKLLEKIMLAGDLETNIINDHFISNLYSWMNEYDQEISKIIA
jgi:kynurenine 3-monooxygenase